MTARQAKGLEREQKLKAQQLANLEDAEKAKQRVVLAANKDAAKAGHWLDSTDEGRAIRDDVIGPMLMDIDVPTPANRKLVENAISEKCALWPLQGCSRAVTRAVPGRLLDCFRADTRADTRAVIGVVTGLPCDRREVHLPASAQVSVWLHRHVGEGA